MGKTVCVVAWQYQDKSGFDWYDNVPDADETFSEERKNYEELAAEGGAVYRFDYTASADMTPEAITDAIDMRFDELCAVATQWFNYEKTP